MKIESSDIDIESLLDGAFFEIPRFQRPYSWDDENISEFWSDLVANKGEDYFIGSMVVFKKAKQQFGVVDGQQRLTTITILICALRDALKDLGEDDLAEGLHQLVERKNRNNVGAFVLKTETTFPYFAEHIQKFGPPELEGVVKPEEANLERAQGIFVKRIQSLLRSVDSDSTILEEDRHSEKLRRLLQIRDTVLNLNLIFVVLDNEDDAYLIFETLNTRGKDLALSDLVKNHITKHLKNKGAVDQAKIKWNDLMERIHNSDSDLSPDAFIYHFWASRYESVPLKKLFPKIKKSITKPKAKGFVSDLVEDSEYYRSIYEPGYMWTKNEGDVSRSLNALVLFKVSQPVPAILSLIRAYKQKQIRLPALQRALEAIEKFHFMFTAVTSSRSSGGISAMYSSFGRKVYEAEGSQEIGVEINKFINKLRERIPTSDEFAASFQEIYFTNSNSKQKNLVRYLLRKFAEADERKYPVDFDELTIEHLFPQKNIGEQGWTSSDVGRLGNLILLDQKRNGELDTKDFAAKRAKLKEWGYELPDVVERNDIWTPELVKEHTAIMANRAFNDIWKI